MSAFSLCWGHASLAGVGWREPPGGSGFNILQLTLIGLKLGGVISWPWSMVLLPLWFTIVVLFIIGLGMVAAVVGQRLSQYLQDRGSGEPVALLVPARREDHTR